MDSFDPYVIKEIQGLERLGHIVFMITVFFTLYYENNDYVLIQDTSIVIIVLMNGFIVYTMIKLLIRVSGPEVKYVRGMLKKYFGYSSNRIQTKDLTKTKAA